MYAISLQGSKREYFAALESTFCRLNKGAGGGVMGDIHDASLAYPLYERGARIYESLLCSFGQHIPLFKQRSRQRVAGVGGGVSMRLA